MMTSLVENLTAPIVVTVRELRALCSSGSQVLVKAVREADDASLVSGILLPLAFGHYRLPIQYR